VRLGAAPAPAARSACAAEAAATAIEVLVAELLRRVYAIDVFMCPWCGGRRRLLAAVHDPEAIRRILVAMGLPVEPPAQSLPRGVVGEGWLPW
jgi:hypothetical protein